MKTITRVIVTIATLLSGIGILVAVVAFPSLSNMVELTGLISQEEQRLAQIASRGLQFKNISLQVQKIKTDLPNLNQMLIPNGKEIAFFTALEQKSRAYDLTHTIRVGQGIFIREIEELPLEIEVQGTVKNILRYLTELERGVALLPLQKVELRTVAKLKDPNAQTVRAIIQTTLYVSKQ